MREILIMKKSILVGLTVLLSTLCAPQTGYAVDFVDNIIDDIEYHMKDGVVLGVGVVYPQRPYKGYDNDVSVVPIIIMEYKRFFIDRTEFGFHVLDNDDDEGNLEVSLMAAPRFGGYEEDDSPDLAGMADRDHSFEMGARLKWKTEYFNITLKGLADVANKHQGQVAQVQISKPFIEGFLTPRIAVEWQSKDFVDYYYGVRSGEAIAGRPAYSGEDTVNFIYGLTIAYPLNEHWVLVGDVQYMYFGEEISDSPIVDEDGVMTYAGGIVYQF